MPVLTQIKFIQQPFTNQFLHQRFFRQPTLTSNLEPTQVFQLGPQLLNLLHPPTCHDRRFCRPQLQKPTYSMWGHISTLCSHGAPKFALTCLKAKKGVDLTCLNCFQVSFFWPCCHGIQPYLEDKASGVNNILGANMIRLRLLCSSRFVKGHKHQVHFKPRSEIRANTDGEKNSLCATAESGTCKCNAFNVWKVPGSIQWINLNMLPAPDQLFVWHKENRTTRRPEMQMLHRTWKPIITKTYQNVLCIHPIYLNWVDITCSNPGWLQWTLAGGMAWCSCRRFDNINSDLVSGRTFTMCLEIGTMKWRSHPLVARCRFTFHWCFISGTIWLLECSSCQCSERNKSHGLREEEWRLVITPRISWTSVHQFHERIDGFGQAGNCCAYAAWNWTKHCRRVSMHRGKRTNQKTCRSANTNHPLIFRQELPDEFKDGLWLGIPQSVD